MPNFVEPFERFQENDLVVCYSEHPNAIGKIMRLMPHGYAVEFTTPRSKHLPFGSIITEAWTFEDAHMLFTKIV